MGEVVVVVELKVFVVLLLFCHVLGLNQQHNCCFVCVSIKLSDRRKLHHRFHIYKVFHQCVSLCEFSKTLVGRRLPHNIGICMVFRQCALACVGRDC